LFYLLYNVDSHTKSDDLVAKQFGQDVIDSLSVLEAVVPTLHQGLWPKLFEIFPMITLALQSRYAIIRQSASRCFATVCDVMTSEAMHYAIENVVPLLGDPLVLSNRQGATELIYRSFIPCFFVIIADIFADIVQKLDIKALPYVIFLVVPILGRMSDSDDDIRSTATNTFASLVKMVPLEVSWLCRSLFCGIDVIFRQAYQTHPVSLETFSNAVRLNANF
jgi:TATA-binding protein-associated factor